MICFTDGVLTMDVFWFQDVSACSCFELVDPTSEIFTSRVGIHIQLS